MTQYVCVCGSDRFPVTFELDQSKPAEQQHSATVALDDDGKRITRVGATQAEALDRLGKVLSTVLHGEVRVMTEDQAEKSEGDATPLATTKPGRKVKVVKKKKVAPKTNTAPKATAEEPPPSADQAVCRNCAFWFKTGIAAVHAPDEVISDGECRFNPPLHIQGAANAKWPVTREDKWCGQHPGRRVR